MTAGIVKTLEIGQSAAKLLSSYWNMEKVQRLDGHRFQFNRIEA